MKISAIHAGFRYEGPMIPQGGINRKSPKVLRGRVEAPLLGMWLGQKLRRAVSPEVFRRMFLAVMFGVGIHLSRALF